MARLEQLIQMSLLVAACGLSMPGCGSRRTARLPDVTQSAALVQKPEGQSRMPAGVTGGSERKGIEKSVSGAESAAFVGSAFFTYEPEKNDADFVNFISGHFIPTSRNSCFEFVNENDERIVVDQSPDKGFTVYAVKGKIGQRTAFYEGKKIEIRMQLPQKPDTRERFRINFAGRKVVPYLERKVTPEYFLAQVTPLPNGACIKKFLPPGEYRFDQKGSILSAPEGKARYESPKIELPLGGSKYLVIPKDADWDDLDSFVKLSPSGVVESRRDTIPGPGEKGIFPVPKVHQIEDREKLDMMLEDAGDLFEKKEFKKAATAFDSALEKASPNSRAKVYYNRALVCMGRLKGKNRPAAVDVASVFFAPAGLYTYFSLRGQKKLVKDAEGFLLEALKSDPDYDVEIRIRYALAQLYSCDLDKTGIAKKGSEKREIFAKEVSNLEKVVELDPDHKDALFRLGTLALNVQEDPKQAQGYFNRVKKIDPNYPNIDENIRAGSHLLCRDTSLPEEDYIWQFLGLKLQEEQIVIEGAPFLTVEPVAPGKKALVKNSEKIIYTLSKRVPCESQK